MAIPLDRIGRPPGARAQVEAQRDRLAGADPPGDLDPGQRAAARRAIDARSWPASAP